LTVASKKRDERFSHWRPATKFSRAIESGFLGSLLVEAVRPGPPETQKSQPIIVIRRSGALLDDGLFDSECRHGVNSAGRQQQFTRKVHHDDGSQPHGCFLNGTYASLDCPKLAGARQPRCSRSVRSRPSRAQRSSRTRRCRCFAATRDPISSESGSACANRPGERRATIPRLNLPVDV
jgi:hypothetical protein